MFQRLFVFAVLLIALSSCSHQHIKEGEGYLQVEGGSIWYKVIGSGNKTPIVLLHGGPGFPSYSLTPLFALATDRQVIVYDQLGCGRSSNLNDTALMNIASQLKDLKTLLQKLEITDFYLYAHSYGTMLAAEYYFKNENLPKALILASPCMSAKRWELDADTLMNSMDAVYRKPLQNFKAGNYKDTALYSEAIKKYYSSFYNRKMNSYIDSSIARSGKALYVHMWGKEEFTVTGNLKNYNRINDLHQIKIPTLFTAGEFDAARPATVKYYQSLTPNSKFVLIENAAHSTMNDNTTADLNAISSFIQSIEE
ncbi:proline iminopeptidase [Lacibacter cauensis]|uniref:Proline iminopeptidase n=1 Tax=Lacibacter cauensis TaxID=510947 RepID=A0A562SH27_9BACT|nr:proline iminopeptidase-family hydrolase [Lacibacter cauensis]TWI80569.1 proline iminopeptidase [Lacibacter cauensis]